MRGNPLRARSSRFWDTSSSDEDQDEEQIDELKYQDLISSGENDPLTHQSSDDFTDTKTQAKSSDDGNWSLLEAVNSSSFPGSSPPGSEIESKFDLQAALNEASLLSSDKENDPVKDGIIKVEVVKDKNDDSEDSTLDFLSVQRRRSLDDYINERSDQSSNNLNSNSNWRAPYLAQAYDGSGEVYNPLRLNQFTQYKIPKKQETDDFKYKVKQVSKQYRDSTSLVSRIFLLLKRKKKLHLSEIINFLTKKRLVKKSPHLWGRISRTLNQNYLLFKKVAPATFILRSAGKQINPDKIKISSPAASQQETTSATSIPFVDVIENLVRSNSTFLGTFPGLVHKQLLTLGYSCSLSLVKKTMKSSKFRQDNGWYFLTSPISKSNNNEELPIEVVFPEYIEE